jgi:hypothetical protein
MQTRYTLGFILITLCAALELPLLPSLNDTYYSNPNRTTTVLRPHYEPKNPQWLFFVSTEIIDPNSTEPLMEWEFVSHITITPEQCGFITNVVEMIDDALKRTNPDVENVTSTAFRLGNNNCVDGQCPCERNETHRRVLVSRLLLEVKTRSPSPDLKAPLQFPLRIKSII